MIKKPTKLENIFTKYQTQDGFNVYNLTQTMYVDPDISPQDFRDYHITQADSWAALSFRFYQDINLWWVLVLVNRDLIKNPVEMPPPGTKVRIPTNDFVTKILSYT